MPRFLLDHTTLQYDGEQEQSLSDRVLMLLDSIAKAKETDFQIEKSEDVFGINILPDVALWEALYQSEKDPFDDKRLQQALSSAINSIPDGIDRQVADFARQIAQDGIAVGLVSLTQENSPATEGVGVFRVSNEASLRVFYRSVFDVENVQENGFYDLAVLAFPNLCFVREHTRFGRFQHPYQTTRPIVIRHLSALNDDYRRISAECDHIPHCITSTFSAQQVDLSPESAQTRNSRAMSQRDVTFAGVAYRCEWHTKLFPTVDRIHFSENANERIGGRILVGKFVDHLDFSFR